MSDRRNVTIVLDDETARWARVEAARRDTSVSRFVGQLLRERMEEGVAYRTAAQRFMARRPYLAAAPDRRLPSRDELHDRRSG